MVVITDLDGWESDERWTV